MNTSTKILVLSLASTAAAFAQSGSPAASAPAAAQPAAAPQAPAAAVTLPPAAPAFTDAQLLEEFGWLVGKRTGLAEWGFKPDEADVIAQGIVVALKGQESPFEVQKIGPAMDEFIQKRQAAVVQAMKEKSSAEAEMFFAKLKDDKTVTALPDGLRYTVVTPGEGTPPLPTDWVRVNYTGTFINGTVFDASERRGKPAEFQLNAVIPGWTEGLQKIGKGGRIKLYVPAHLAYGDEANKGIPPGSTLIFDVALLDISPTAFTAEAPAAAVGK